MNPPVRVVHVCVAIDQFLGGAISACVGTACLLNTIPNGLRNELLSFGNSQVSLSRSAHLFAKLTSAQVEVNLSSSHIPNKYGLGFNASLLKQFSQIRTADVVIFHQIYTLGSLLGSLFTFYLRKPFIVVPHGTLTNYHQSIRKLRKIVYKPLTFILLNKCSSIVVTSEQESRELFPSLQLKSHIIGFGKQVELKQRLRYGEIKNFLFVGRITPKKNLPLLIEAFIKIARERPELSLEIVGGGDENIVQECMQIIDKNPTHSKQISFHGWLSGENLASAYRRADCFVMPSQEENFSLVCMEALNFGIPCIVSEQVGISDVIRKYNAGLVMKTTTVESLAMNMRNMTESNLLLLSDNAKLACKNEFDDNKIANQWRQVIEEAIKDSGGNQMRRESERA